jgi:small subunit ribosomal protein S1
MLQELVKKQDLIQKTTKELPTQGLEDFDWDAYTEGCPSRMRKGNPHVKVPHGVKVYSLAKDAQQMYHMYEGSLDKFVSKVSNGDHLVGKIYSIDSRWATIDVGHRELIYIDLDRESPAFKELIQKDKEFTVKIIDDSSSKGFCLGSVTEGTKQAIINDLMAAAETKSTAYAGRIDKMIPGGGYMVTVQGIECFMPGSLAGINKLANFESIIGTDMYVVPVSFSPEKGTIVVSHRAYLQAMIPQHIEELRANMEKEQEGYVTGSTKYGVFVEFNGCLTGMIHINDLSTETTELYTKGNLNPGTPITFFVKDIISTTKITLTQKTDSNVNPWNGASTRYAVPQEVQGTVRSIKDYGLFIEIEEGITGLLHSSELEGINIQDIKKGDPITVVITRIEEETRKVFLKLV